jgi:methionyl-tRNA formyltransferase
MNGSVSDAERLVRAVTRPYPGAYYLDSAARKVIVWSAAKSDIRPDTDFLEFKDGYLAILQSEQLSD